MQGLLSTHEVIVELQTLHPPLEIHVWYPVPEHCFAPRVHGEGHDGALGLTVNVKLFVDEAP